MNTHLPAKPDRSAKPAILAGERKSAEVKQSAKNKTGKFGKNASLRYPEELERCFVLGNN